MATPDSNSLAGYLCLVLCDWIRVSLMACGLCDQQTMRCDAAIFYIRSFLRSPSLKYSLDSDSFVTSLINCQCKFKFKAFAYRLSWLVVCFLFIHRSHHSFFHSHRNFYQTRDFCNINAMSCSLCLTFTNKVRVQKTHKPCTCRSDLEGGPDVKMLHCNKLYLKSISSHSESFWRKKIWVNNGGTPTLSHFSPILAI